ncbi:hypothetical protein CLOSTASPAR_01465 [[Clostridium] asparagiforme DSM 15981]|uniref:Uncharacterized protein n=1 Tax=[Clostridium] asparagiforme DSM 15981 TaxID=518636 RepID=C0CWU4_9FIRM|nr:hypothetical protein CLOSTASPAR_01465 [[Clostridium] asparagiforme DSM 15981]
MFVKQKSDVFLQTCTIFTVHLQYFNAAFRLYSYLFYVKL